MAETHGAPLRVQICSDDFNNIANIANIAKWPM
jgi:hypothetical protein